VTERPLLAGGQLAGGQSTRTLPEIAGAVDELHVAAVLESMGVTDPVAQDTYGHDDVFALADVVYRQLPTVADLATSDDLPSPPRSQGALRVLTHGPLYMLPSMVYPALLIALGPSAMFRGLVFTTALGWVWGMGMSVVAYQLVGQGMERSAGRALRLLGLTGLAIALLSGTLLAVTGPGGAGLVAFAVAQMSFQLMSGVLVFYGKELRLAVTMLPTSVAGIVFLVSGDAAALVVPTLVVGGLSIVMLAVTTWVTSTRAPVRPDARHPVAPARTFAGAVPSMCYAALCAVYFLNTDARFLIGQVDLAIAAVPLILGMGALEWRAHRFTERAGELFGRTAMSSEFRRAAWRLLLAELTNCLVILGSLGAVFLVALGEFGLLSFRGAMLADAYVLLGGAFFLGFVMARHQQLALLLGIMSPLVVAEVLMAGRFAPHGQVPIFLLSTAILLLLQTVTLRASFRRAYLYQ
jgi:hypothetical protein